MFKIMTYNIQHGIDHLHRLKTSEFRIDLSEIARVIKSTDASIISLNEVYDAPEKDLEHQAQVIAGYLGYNYVFGKAINIRGGEYGNALLSKYPILEYEIIKIDDATKKDEPVFYESRSIIKSKIKANNTIYNVFVSHFGLAKEEQKNGTNKILELINGLEHVIFMGDLNMMPTSMNRVKLKDHLISTVPDEFLSFPSSDLFDRRDYIFVSKDIKYEDAKVLDTIFSDHLPLITTIK